MKKTAITSFVLLLTNFSSALACEVCKKNQPKVLENITHGSGPTGTIDYIITWSAVVIVTITLVMSIRFLIRPKETGVDHIKNIVMNQPN